MASGHLRAYLEHYFPPHSSAQMRELFVSRVILNFAAASVALFEPIYLHSIGFSFAQIMLFYAAIYALYLVALPLGGKIARKHGYEHGILFSSPFLVIWYLSFLAMPFNKAFVVVAVLAIVMQKILYWPGYHAYFTAGSSRSEEGRELSLMSVLAGLAAAVAPAFGGAVIAFVGYKPLFFMVAALIMLSNVPLLRTPEVYLPQRFSYWDAVARFFSVQRRRRFVTFFGYGEELLMLVAWPLFLAIMIPDARLIGAIFTAAMLCNAAVTLYVGRLTDNGNRASVQRAGVVYTSLSWIVRPFITTGFAAFLVEAYYHVAKNMIAVPLTADAYDAARDGGAMEEIVFFEMALSAGKLCAALIGAVVFASSGNPWTAVFIIATAFTVLYAASSHTEPART